MPNNEFIRVILEWPAVKTSRNSDLGESNWFWRKPDNYG